MINTPTQKLVDAYFNGGNVKDIKTSKDLRVMLETIKSFVESTEQKEVEKRNEELYEN
ncbi:hypothetical protein KAT95_01400 [Candidatus Parcubacteria bacterium]|nr:hypothetical protein [Candidatus Parcubacteria bacterium]